MALTRVAVVVAVVMVVVVATTAYAAGKCEYTGYNSKCATAIGDPGTWGTNGTCPSPGPCKPAQQDV